MSLTKKQIKWILGNRKKYSVQKMADKINADIIEIEKILEENPEIKTPKTFYLLMLLIPIAFFILLEIGLRITSYGTDTKTWIQASSDKISINHNIAARYFTNVNTLPQTIKDTFDKEKKENSFRVFVLGGSSAAGYPYMPMGSFSRYIRKRLELFSPNANIEVINLAITATNSYTILDLIPEVLKQKPDLILIYAGHNEYYGALGVGSLESLGRSREVVNLLIRLNKYKTVQLIRNIINGILSLTSSDKKPSGTLMARMAEKKSIPLNSDIYNLGIRQFEGNTREVLSQIDEQKIPVIISTLTSNLKDQSPFVSSNDQATSAKAIYDEASELYSETNIDLAKELYTKAKDYDQLRFRASSDLNNTIRKLAKGFDIELADAENEFNICSKFKIVGNDLMIDHLHPTLKGYQLLGKIFFDKMIEKNYLPKTYNNTIGASKQDSLTINEFVISPFDIKQAEIKIDVLKHDWPFVKNGSTMPMASIVSLHSYMDTLAYQFVSGNIEWEPAQRKLALYYLKKKDCTGYINQMEVLITQFPFMTLYYDMIAKEMLSIGRFDEVYSFLLKRYKIRPDYFSSKWLGTIELSRENVENAITYLEKSVSFNQKDAQVFYNLSGAYAKNKEFKKALQNINYCLALDSTFPGAKDLQKQLMSLTKE